jgi:hypothetical protein
MRYFYRSSFMFVPTYFEPITNELIARYDNRLNNALLDLALFLFRLSGLEYIPVNIIKGKGVWK